MRQKESIEIIKMMTRYGVTLGALIGFAGAIPIALTWFDLSLLLPVLALTVIITMCGGLVGALYGVISGFSSGVLMKIVTRYIFREVNEQALYKGAMGLLSAIAIISIFLVDKLFIGGQQADFFTRSIPITDWYAVWLMSVVFAVYASQRTANEYLQYAIKPATR